LRPAQSNSSRDLISKITRAKWRCDSSGTAPANVKFKPQSNKKKKKKKKKGNIRTLHPRGSYATVGDPQRILK
jgi:NADH:ubiquinone oxidoreductase subunit